MPTQDAILNSALRLLGEPADVGPNFKTDYGRKVFAAYEPAALSLFESHALPFAERVELINPLAHVEPDYKYAFNLPAGHLRTNAVRSCPDEMAPDAVYAERRGMILSDEEGVWIWFNHSDHLTQPGGWPNLVGDWLAAEIADEVYPSTDEGDPIRSRIMMALQKRSLEAKVFMGNAEPVQRRRESRFLSARTSGYYRR